MEIKELKSSKHKLLYGFRKAFIQDANISMGARFLLILLMTYKGMNDFCWPSVRELSNKFGKNKDTVRKHLRELEQKGYLVTRSRGIGRSHLYIPTYHKNSSGLTANISFKQKPTEENIVQPAESTLNRSVTLGNKDKETIDGWALFEEKRKELGLL